LIFAALSVLATCIVSIGLTVGILRDRSLLLKPSIVVLGFYHLCIQWPSTLYATIGPGLDFVARRGLDSFYTDWAVPWGWHFFVLAQVFPLMGLFGSLFIFRRSAREQWSRITVTSESSLLFFHLVLGLMILAVVVYYFSVVPLQKTGLYAILFSPANYAFARENSLKLLTDKKLQYLFSWMTSVLVPFFCVTASFAAWDCLKRRRMIPGVILIVLIVIGIVASSLTGAKWPPAFTIFVLILAWLLRRKMRFSFWGGIAAFCLILGLPVVFTIMRAPSLLWMDAVWLMLHRTFFAPMEACRDYVRYTMEVGYLGIAAYPKLARLVDVIPIDLPNVIHRYYFNHSVQTGSHTASFVFFNYAAFGIGSFIISLLSLWALDLLTLFYRFIANSTLLIACMAVVTAASTSFVSSDYMVTLVTHGVVVSFGVAIFLEWAGALWQKR